MGSMSVWHWLIFMVVALLLFGGSGRISSIMGDVAKGVKSFKKGLEDDDEDDKRKAEEARQKALGAGTQTAERTTDRDRA